MSAALIGGRLLTALPSLSSCSQRAPFILLCLVRFPGPNHLRVARLVHGASIKASLYFKRLSLNDFIKGRAAPQPVYPLPKRASGKAPALMRTCRALHLPVSQAAQPRISATTTESTIGGGPKYKKLSTTPGNCRIKNAQPMKPAAVGVERANCPRCHDRNADRSVDTVQDNPKP